MFIQGLFLAFAPSQEPVNVMLNYINSGGVVALLVLLLWLGYSGRVISHKHLETIIATVVKEVLKELRELESD